jgi:hypothetical protein
MPKVITLGTLEVKGAEVIGVVGVELFTLTTIGFAAKPRVGVGTVSHRGLAAMEALSHTSRVSGQTQAVMQCTTAPSELSSIAVMVSIDGGSALGQCWCGVGMDG